MRPAGTRIDSAPGAAPCRVKVELLGTGKGKHARSAKRRKKGKGSHVLGRAQVTIAGGQSATVKVKLTKRGRTTIRRHRGLRVRVTTLDPAGDTVQIKPVKLHGKKKHHKH